MQIDHPGKAMDRSRRDTVIVRLSGFKSIIRTYPQIAFSCRIDVKLEGGIGSIQITEPLFTLFHTQIESPTHNQSLESRRSIIDDMLNIQCRSELSLVVVRSEPETSDYRVRDVERRKGESDFPFIFPLLARSVSAIVPEA